MLKPKYYEHDNGKERWLISYVDIVTILLILFVALAGRVPLQPVVAAPPPAPVVKPQPEPKKDALDEAAEKLRAQGLELVSEQRGMVLHLPHALLFGPGQAELKPEALPMLEHVAGVLRELPNQLLLVGHADAQPLHSGRYKSNWELSAARSLRLLELLSTRYGVPEERLLMAGRGAESPSQSNSTPNGRAANRRVEIVMLR